MKNIGQIKAMIGFVVFLIVAAIIGLVVFLATVKLPENNTEEEQPLPSETTSYEQIEVSNVITSSENNGSTFKLYDSNGVYSVELENGVVTFNVEDKDLFERDFPSSKFHDETVIIATHNYKIKDVFLGIMDEEEYVIVITNDGRVGTMNVKEAVNDNVFRIKNKLLEFEQKIAFIQKVSISDGTEDIASTLAVAVDGTIYDLSSFLDY